MNDIEGLHQKAARSDLDFHHPKGASLDMVNVASPTPCVCLRILQECFSLCSRSYPLPIFRNSENPLSSFPPVSRPGVHPGSKYRQPRLPQLPLSTLPLLSSLLYHIAPHFLTSNVSASTQTSPPRFNVHSQQTHVCNVRLADYTSDL